MQIVASHESLTPDASGTMSLATQVEEEFVDIVDAPGETVYASLVANYDAPVQIRYLSSQIKDVYTAGPPIEANQRLGTKLGTRAVVELWSVTKVSDDAGENARYAPMKVSLVIAVPQAAEVTDSQVESALTALFGACGAIDGGFTFTPVIHKLRLGKTDILG